MATKEAVAGDGKANTMKNIAAVMKVAVVNRDINPVIPLGGKAPARALPVCRRADSSSQ